MSQRAISTSETLDLIEDRAGADGRAHAVAALDEEPRHVRADQPGGAGDEGDAHTAGVWQHALRSVVMPVAIVTDTTHYMPRETVEAAGLHEVSLYVNDGGTLERESDMAGFDAFYERLRSSSDLPTTSQPSIGDFLEVYEPLVEAGNDIVSVHLCGGISGTCESARQAAAEIVGARRTAAHRGRRLAQRLRRAGPRRARGGGGGARRRERRAGRRARARRRPSRPRSGSRSTRSSILRRGGRIGAASALLGSALRIKPILTIEDVITPDRARAHRASARSSGWSTTCGCGRATARRRGSSSTSRPRRPASAWSRRGREIFGTEPRLLLRDRAGDRHARRPGPARRLRARPGAAQLAGRAPASRVIRSGGDLGAQTLLAHERAPGAEGQRVGDRGARALARRAAEPAPRHQHVAGARPGSRRTAPKRSATDGISSTSR